MPGNLHINSLLVLTALCCGLLRRTDLAPFSLSFPIYSTE